MNNEKKEKQKEIREESTPTGTPREHEAAENMISELKSAYESAARMRESPAHRKIVLEITRALREEKFKG